MRSDKKEKKLSVADFGRVPYRFRELIHPPMNMRQNLDVQRAQPVRPDILAHVHELIEHLPLAQLAAVEAGMSMADFEKTKANGLSRYLVARGPNRYPRHR